MPGPHLYKRAESEVWWWNARIKGQLVRGSTGKRDPGEAREAAATAWLEACHRLRAPVPAGTDITLPVLVALYLKDLRRRLDRRELVRGPRFYENVDQALRRVSARWKRIEDVAPDWSNALGDWHAERPPVTWRYLQIVTDAARKLLRWAHAAGHLAVEPKIAAPKSEAVVTEQEERRPFTARERDRFLAVVRKADPRAHRIYTVLFYTAARKSDLERLTWRQVDLRGGWLTFPPRQTKSKKRDQVVGLHKKAAAALRAELREHKVVDPSALVFGRFNFRHEFPVWCKAAGITDMQGVVPHHVTRHTTATLAGDADASLAELMALGRWSTPQMALRYMKVQAKASKKALDRL